MKLQQNVVLYIYVREKEKRVKFPSQSHWPSHLLFFFPVIFCFLVPDQKRNGWIEKRTDGQVYKQRGIISYIKCDIQSEKESGGDTTTTDLAQSKKPRIRDVERIELSANSKRIPLKKFTDGNNNQKNFSSSSSTGCVTYFTTTEKSRKNQ